MDFETTFQTDDKKRTDPSPYDNRNYLVSVGYLSENCLDFGLDNDEDKVNYSFLKHSTAPNINSKGAHSRLQDTLNKTTLLVAHNAKFELAWLRACGFTYNGKIACTQIREYVLAKGQKLGVSLKESCERNNLARKKSDLVDEYLRKGIGFEAMPWEVVQEYGIADIISCKELYYNQLERLKDNSHLWPTIELMEEFCVCLTEIEETGIKIDVKELTRLEDEYRTTLNQLRKDLEKIAEDVMGATKVNLDSPQQLSELIFSRRVKDKKVWKDLFNLGSEIRGSVRKPKHPKKYSKRDFIDIVRNNTEVIYKTTAEHCDVCNGRGSVQRTKKSGEFFARESRCNNCGGNGFSLRSLADVAGFKLPPEGVGPAVGGFSTDKATLEALSAKARDGSPAKEFLTKMVEINKISNYLDTMIEGIKRGIKDNHILHTSFMQTVVATGRLSSRNPNFQNLPRANTFPLRKCIISRFKNGIILEGDFRQLEFRIAGELSNDQQIFKDIADGIDVHAMTAKHTTLSRQDAKPITFSPVYGAQEHGKPDNIVQYFRYFRERYKGHDEWKLKTLEEILANGGFYRLPSGREYYFPNTVRRYNGTISNATIIANYPVQGFATADCVPIAVISTWKLLKRLNLKSKIILTVHDSIEIDCHPDELEICVNILKEGMLSVKDECLRRYQYELKIPLEVELKAGPNWLELKEIH